MKTETQEEKNKENEFKVAIAETFTTVDTLAKTERVGVVIASLCKAMNIRTSGIKLGEQVKELGTKAKELIESGETDNVRQGLSLIGTIEMLCETLEAEEQDAPETSDHTFEEVCYAFQTKQEN